MKSGAVRLQNVTTRFGERVVVDRVSFQLEQGEFFSILGPSGCGKTTTLRTIAGFLAPDQGEISVDGRDVIDKGPHERDMGMVYQNYALFPHMTVFGNVAFGLEMRKTPRRETHDRVMRALTLVHLETLARRYPRQLSGGEQQRVALARAIVIEPSVLLLDEPLSNLDAQLRRNMQLELRQLQRSLGITAIYVTHDQEEALTLSDRVMVMNSGRVMQIDSPSNLYKKPANLFVASFIGRSNILAGQVTDSPGSNVRRFVSDEGLELLVSSGDLARPPGPANVSIRPEGIQPSQGGGQPGLRNQISAIVEHVVFGGSVAHYYVRANGGPSLLVETTNTSDITRFTHGHKIQLTVSAADVYLIPNV